MSTATVADVEDVADNLIGQAEDVGYGLQSVAHMDPQQRQGLLADVVALADLLSEVLGRLEPPIPQPVPGPAKGRKKRYRDDCPLDYEDHMDDQAD